MSENMHRNNQTEGIRSQALATYTLNKFKHANAEEELQKLKSIARKDDNRQWWSDKNESDFNPHHWWRYIYTHDVETTSYALLALLEQSTVETDELLPIIRWLMAQRNSFGGFVSTQDTIVGLQALVKFVEKSNYESAQMQVDVSGSGGERQKKDTLHLNNDNSLLYQTVEVCYVLFASIYRENILLLYIYANFCSSSSFDYSSCLPRLNKWTLWPPALEWL